MAQRCRPRDLGGLEVPERLLLHNHAALSQPWERGTGLGELAALLGVSRRPTAWLPPVALLHSQVPQVPGVRASGLTISSPAPPAPAAAPLAVAVPAVAPAGLLLHIPEHGAHLPRSRKGKWETKNRLPGREAVTAKSGAVCAPYGAFPPGSAMLDMAVGTRRPRRWKRYQRTRSQLVRLEFAVTWFTASLPEACWQQFARGPSAPSRAILCEKFGQAVVGRGVDPAGRVEQALQPAGGQQLLHGPPGGQLAVGPGP
jgi:hypothetical protein